jgi:hypothetical protein
MHVLGGKGSAAPAERDKRSILEHTGDLAPKRNSGKKKLWQRYSPT